MTTAWEEGPTGRGAAVLRTSLAFAPTFLLLAPGQVRGLEGIAEGHVQRAHPRAPSRHELHHVDTREILVHGEETVKGKAQEAGQQEAVYSSVRHHEDAPRRPREKLRQGILRPRNDLGHTASALERHCARL